MHANLPGKGASHCRMVVVLDCMPKKPFILDSWSDDFFDDQMAHEHEYIRPTTGKSPCARTESKSDRAHSKAHVCYSVYILLGKSNWSPSNIGRII